ncbi:MAG: hypothetical protein ACFFDT_14230 [Candidatus Hodarchaeota archaeon]
MVSFIIKLKPIWTGIVGGFLVFFILFSGCIIPLKSPLEQNFSRVTDDIELEAFSLF